MKADTEKVETRTAGPTMLAAGRAPDASVFRLLDLIRSVLA